MVSMIALFGLRGPEEGIDGWMGVSTSLGSRRFTEDYLAEFRIASATMEAAKDVAAEVLVLPESAAGEWHDVARSLWMPWLEAKRRAGTRVVVGATKDLGERFENGALVFGEGEEELWVPERIPIPLVSWRPWDAASARATWAKRNVVRIADRRVGVLICYEAGLLWPVLLDAAAGAEGVVALANLGWMSGTAYGRTMRQAVKASSRLMGLPFVFAANE